MFELVGRCQLAHHLSNALRGSLYQLLVFPFNHHAQQWLRAGRAQQHAAFAIQYLLGINHRRLTYRHNGRNERLTDNFGEIIDQAIG